jgi:hypothetical protein
MLLLVRKTRSNSDRKSGVSNHSGDQFSNEDFDDRNHEQARVVRWNHQSVLLCKREGPEFRHGLGKWRDSRQGGQKK